MICQTRINNSSSALQSIFTPKLGASTSELVGPLECYLQRVGSNVLCWLNVLDFNVTKLSTRTETL